MSFISFLYFYFPLTRKTLSSQLFFLLENVVMWTYSRYFPTFDVDKRTAPSQISISDGPPQPIFVGPRILLLGVDTTKLPENMCCGGVSGGPGGSKFHRKRGGGSTVDVLLTVGLGVSVSAMMVEDHNVRAFRVRIRLFW